jgi:RecB family endonuclease NucS
MRAEGLPNRWSSIAAAAIIWALALASCATLSDAFEFRTAKVCQLTGEQDRQRPDKLTGSELGGETGNAMGTDLGFPFEHGGRLHFLFGDTTEHDPDRCEPELCGTGEQPKIPRDGNPKRWATAEAWNAWFAKGRDGADSIATAPLAFDPEQCIPLRFQADDGGVFAHEISGNNVGVPFQLSGPKVAANPQDKWVLVMGNRILVVTQDGSVFAHEVSGNSIGVPFQLSGPKVAANPQDKWVLVMGNRILVVTQDGSVFAHEVSGNSIGVPFQLSGPRVAANPQDEHVLTMGNRIVVITQDGRVFAHEVSDNSVGVPFQLSGPKVAANPQDEHVLTMGNRIVVITQDGRVFAHEVNGNNVGVPFQLSGPKVAANPQDRWIVVMGTRVVVATKDLFRPTRLNGRVLGRFETPIGGFSDGAQNMYVFFSVRDFPPGCTLPQGCALGDASQPAGGQSKLVVSTSGASDFNNGDGSVFAHQFSGNSVGVPFELSGSRVAANVQDKWVLAMDGRIVVITQDGGVFAHEISGNNVGVPFQLSGPKVAANPQDKRVLVMGNRIVVVTQDGGVFAHEISGNNVGVPFQLSGPKVAANPQDKWVLVMGNRILVVTQDGIVFAHEVSGNSIGVPFQLSGPRVAANPQDKWVLVMGNRILVVTQDGSVFAHEVSGNSIGVPFQLSGPRVAANPQDKWLLARNNGVLVITIETVSKEKFQWPVPVMTEANSIPGLPSELSDRVVLIWGSGRDAEHHFRHGYPYLAVAPLAAVSSMQTWRYYAGLDAQGKPRWDGSESAAQPLPPFGSPVIERDPRFGPGYHKCVGEFSVRFIDAWRKWVMMYACGSGGAYNSNNLRGIHLRTADAPWGPWSPPFRVFDPGQGYCQFIHAQDPSSCKPGDLNPFEAAVRDAVDPAKLAYGGEYAPFLLPSRYVQVDGDTTTLYFTMSTWNPYQVVLMKTEVSPTPR